jgi:hypothetical protein
LDYTAKVLAVQKAHNPSIKKKRESRAN